MTARVLQNMYAVAPMDVGALTEALAESGAHVSLTLGDVALDELLLTAHAGRFTGAIRLGDPPKSDRLCFREGALVGLQPRPDDDGPGLSAALKALQLVSEETWAAVSDDGAREPRAIAKALLEQRLVDEDDMQRAIHEHTRRRLFALYDLSTETSVRVRQGLEQLAGFWPVPTDVRPVVAFGMVVRASPARRAAILEKVCDRVVRIVAPYDEQRNSYGLPPPVVTATKSLEHGFRMSGTASLPGLSTEETAGLLLLLDRIALLRIEL